MNWLRVFGIVTFGALVGMVLAGAFGYVAGSLAPALFLVGPPGSADPVTVALTGGAIVGVLLGGGLAVFGILIQTAWQWMRSRPEQPLPLEFPPEIPDALPVPSTQDRGVRLPLGNR